MSMKSIGVTAIPVILKYRVKTSFTFVLACLFHVYTLPRLATAKISLRLLCDQSNGNTWRVALMRAAVVFFLFVFSSKVYMAQLLFATHAAPFDVPAEKPNQKGQWWLTRSQI